MSVYIENNHNNISQYLPTCEAPKDFSIVQMIRKAKFWADRSRQRKQLARLDGHLLADVGITQEQANVEISKPFWR
jgi:uncharacterized protein YjiS (DUF1127 family)